LKILVSAALLYFSLREAELASRLDISKRIILAGRRHVTRRARKGGKDFAWRIFAVPVEAALRGA
jgi:hypothetical protein